MRSASGKATSDRIRESWSTAAAVPRLLEEHVSFVPADDEHQHALDFYRAVGERRCVTLLCRSLRRCSPRARCW
jgi:hypothetical protein